ncbi:MAG: cyclic nucleotide-binding domain-containing protein, partial [Rhodocyclaceae bacterium]|nr:cyclic nucleotide-binding domain-containing protein [Rhodocyclaceae bacterium]
MEPPLPSAIFGAIEPLGDASAYVDHILAIIEHIRVFEDFERADVEFMARYMHCGRAGPGTELIREGEAGDFMLMILEGRIEIVKMTPQGLPQRIAVDGPGKILGEMSLIDGAPRFASCVTLEPTLFAVLDREGLARLITDNPKVGVKILMELLMLLNQRLRIASTELVKCR